MKRTIVALSLIMASMGMAHAKDNAHHLDFNQAVANAKAKGLIDGTVSFHLAGTGGGQVIKKGLVSNKKTNGFGKDVEIACEHALHSALISFQNAAKANGATKVVNIVSYYKKNEYKSSTQYECHDGATVTGVTIKGDLAK